MVMAGQTKTTIYLAPNVYRALKVKSATTDRSISDLINAAVIEALREDALDLEAFEKRAKEPSRSFEKVLEDLKRDGLL
jgi:predicted CopG family antitoxin